MTTSLFEARRDLQTVLLEENAALLATDFPAAAALLPRKMAAFEVFLAAQPDRSPSDPVPFGRTLRTVMTENTRLLEQAIEVQTRVVEIIARAARRSEDSGPRYGAQGHATRAGGALALVTRA